MKHSKQSPGFSLILSLTVMAGLVMLIVTVSAFITIESRAAMNQQLATRARLNGIVAMRLALAHLQQEAGPDRRSTARADITQPEVVFAYKYRNPMWTGIWRTDLPDLPPAWLISGRADQDAGFQSRSLLPTDYRTNKKADYPSGYWYPWLSSYTPTDDTLVSLVGAATALPDSGSRPSGLVALPKIALPDENINGTYAYWIGDEGIKARVNLPEVRSGSAADIDQLISLRSPVTHGLLKDLPKQEELPMLSRLDQAPLLTSFDTVIAKGSPIDFRQYFHDVSLSSAGVLSDPLNGGLKRDLSLAFELSDDLFAKTEFGQGNTDGAAATLTEKGFEAVQMPVLQLNGGKTLSGAPMFSRTVTDGQVRGPTWWALRDYHRLYKQVGWTAGSTGDRSSSIPSFRARSLWPNVAAAHPSGPPASSGLPNNSLRNRLYGYADVYDGDLPTPINPNASDLLNGDTGRLITRPLNVAATPYVQRVTLAFTVNKMAYYEWTLVKGPKSSKWWYLPWVDIRLNITPIVVIHNPYNVRMTWAPGISAGSGQAYAASVSFADLAGWKFKVKQYTDVTRSSFYNAPSGYQTDITDFFKGQSPDSDTEDTFRFYLAQDTAAAADKSITLEPGELRVFSCKPVIGDWAKSIALDNTYDNRGGYRDHIPDWNFGDAALDSFNVDLPIGLEIVPGDKLRMRHALTCWPGDQLDMLTGPAANANADKTNFLSKSSEVTEVVFTDIASKHPSAGERVFADWYAIQDKYDRPLSPYDHDGRKPWPTPTSPPLPADIVAVIDITAKTADATDAPYPAFTHSNPLAATVKASAGGRTSIGTDKGHKGISPSYQLTIRTDSWDNVFQFPVGSAGKKAFGGYATDTSGTEKAILSEIPLAQPTTFAQYAHANFGVRDQQPLLSIGNSFATPFVNASKAIQDTDSNWTEFDQTYLLNATLWDGFFLSSAAPWMNTGNDPIKGEVTAVAPKPSAPDATSATADPNEKKPLKDVISDFVHKGVPLDNPRFSIEHTGLDPAATEAAMNDYRRSATVLLNKGAFNVNSTSFTAWQVFLGSAKKFALAGQAASAPKTSENARFPRVLTKEAMAPAFDSNKPTEINMQVGSNWSGFANLTDSQIDNLAKAIIDENKARFGILTRTERDAAPNTPGLRLFGGLTQARTPYLSLSEFVNRFLTTDSWTNRSGALQAAILRADQAYATALSDRLFSNLTDRKVSASSLSTPTAGFFPYPENIEVSAQAGTSRTHTAMGAPGNLLQSDLLQSLGSAITTRSDTFTIRCFGEATQTSGETGMAWMEVLVQRVPEFIDPTNPAETGNSAPRPLLPAASAVTDASVSTALTKVNSVLGRRFKVISMRWLKANEI
jgi:hypothetical protein